jgi:protein-disulfide isomerase
MAACKHSASRGATIFNSLVLLALSACSGKEAPTLPSCVVPIGNSPTRGPADAWVTAVEFGDFECSYCGRAEPTIKEVDLERPGIVRWVWKHLPITSKHPRALPAAIAAECAHDQNHFWEMHDLIYANQTALNDTDLSNYAQQIGLDMTTWQACLNTDPPKQRILADEDLAARARVDGTPTFFINGVALLGAQPLDSFLSIIDAAQQSAMTSSADAGSYYSAMEGRGCL